MSERKVCKLRDISIMRNGQKRPKGGGEYPVYGGNGIMEFSNSYNAENIIVVGRVGAYCGNVHRCKGKCWISDNAISLSANNFVDTDYLYYLLCSLNLNHQHIGGAQPLITQDIIGRFEISLPSLGEQRRIVDILIAIDRKIEINKRINDNLEQQTQALYKSWFIDFEPFKDGKFIDSELGLIPEGWRVGELSEITNITSGKRPSTKSDYPTSRDKVPVFGASGIMAYTTDKLYDIPMLIIGRVGTLGIVQKIDDESWPSDNTLVILSKNYHFVYFNLKSIDYQAINRGSTQPLITQSDIKQQMILIPQDEVLMKFEENANILDKAIKNNDKAIKRLALLRDILLPKLMSGELKINDLDC